jgi:uncharacterized repeat protein (TIGR03837 family)
MWDLFCHVVDNYGDIGVSWRLARTLGVEQRAPLRMWVDDLAAFAAIEPRVRSDAPVQSIDGVEIRRWADPFPSAVPGEAVIEAFGCAPPEPFLDAMAARDPAPVWINLEYLTAEPFAAECHGLPSPHPRRALTKHFFFPGFDPRTGGVLRERDLIAERDAAQRARSGGPLRVSVFAYESAAFAGLLAEWAAGDRPVECLVPAGPAVSAVRAFAGHDVPIGAHVRRGALDVRVLPFTDQHGYDRLLWSCDWNFVRGEDSFVRAQWAARPLVWQPYVQAAGAHVPKLDAFLDRYTAGVGADAARAVRDLMHAWSGVPGAPAVGAAWRAAAACGPVLQAHAAAWADALAAGPELAATLAKFIRDRVK